MFTKEMVITWPPETNPPSEQSLFKKGQFKSLMYLKIKEIRANGTGDFIKEQGLSTYYVFIDESSALDFQEVFIQNLKTIRPTRKVFPSFAIFDIAQ